MSTDPLSSATPVLEALSAQFLDVSAVNRWIVEAIYSYVKRPVLEMSSGQGAISAVLVEKGIPMRLSDKHKGNRDLLRERFKGIEAVRRVYSIDFCHPEFESLYTQLFGSFGTVIALNVLENGNYEPLALRNARHLLRPHGHLILITQVYTSMYFGLEYDLENWRKYNRRELKGLLNRDFEIIRTYYLNLALPLGLSVLAVARKI